MEGCPANAFSYNRSQCACIPGYLFNSTTNSCDLLPELGPPLELSSGVDNYDSLLSFPETIFSFDSIRKFTQSQAVFLEATLVMLLCWLGFCLLMRLFPLASNGHSPWFKIRWWISRLDISFATRHWLHDRKPLVKRKTELGGAFSIASWILFIGFFAALLYQFISRTNVEVHNIRAVNAPDLASFLNDFEFNITTISNMSCEQLRGLETVVLGNPLFIDHRVYPLSLFSNASCRNTTLGPSVSLRCNSCRLFRDFTYVSWHFIDIPNSPAVAIGFQFNLTAKNHGSNKHLSFVSGFLKNSSESDGRPVTYRGAMPNILKFNLFPRLYRNLRDLKLIQPLFQDFLPGSYFGDANQLRASLESSSNGLINTTLCINFLSSYIVEIDNQNISGPVSFLADLGGLYCISIGIFFCFLVQCEYRIKRLRNEDRLMMTIRNRTKAQDRWDKLRKYVRYTWGSCSLDDGRSGTDNACCSGLLTKPFHQSMSSRRRRLQGFDGISFSQKKAQPQPEHVHSQEVRSCLTEGDRDQENNHLSQNVNQ
ncbi:Unknown protein [Striga hermonthica]|uniref:Uncharacterized protein n=1 Tax=Striga hermonthica TaxID=68872 RepID=A0A9N7RAX8_STRHE|nr:Unknown protein [Striga hermonthica]